jgi:hypothetical protein
MVVKLAVGKGIVVRGAQEVINTIPNMKLNKDFPLGQLII